MNNITDKNRAGCPIKSGFTLIEMLIVVLIVAILAAIALPQYNTSVERAKMTEAVTLTKQIAEANRRYYLATGVYAGSIAELDIDIPGEDYTYNGNIRKQTKNFIYTAAIYDGSGYLALAQRIPFAQKYLLFVHNDNDKIHCTIYDNINDIQRKLCTQIDSTSTI